jgi:competence protein ComFB
MDFADKERAMAAFAYYNFENLKNEAETHIFDELALQLDNYPLNVCRCNDCVGDMAAVALNTVAPKYRWSLLGGLYTASAINDGAYRESIQDAVRNAIEIVRANPSHDRQELAGTKELPDTAGSAGGLREKS